MTDDEVCKIGYDAWANGGVSAVALAVKDAMNAYHAADQRKLQETERQLIVEIQLRKDAVKELENQSNHIDKLVRDLDHEIQQKFRLAKKAGIILMPGHIIDSNGDIIPKPVERTA